MLRANTTSRLNENKYRNQKKKKKTAEVQTTRAKKKITWKIENCIREKSKPIPK